MTLHLSRDFLFRPNSLYTNQTFGLYAAAIFLRSVLGFSIVGHTNFNISTGSVMMASGTDANLNLGTNLERSILIPTSTYILSANDANRILVLKSTSNPLFNSGLFRITGITSGSNIAHVQTRGTSSLIAETNTTWAIYENENTFAAGMLNGANTQASTKYRGWDSSATTSRIILQSPHSTAWQVRLTYEVSTEANDSLTNTIGSAASCTPGFSGSSIGDFTPAGKHLHIPLWWNTTSTSNSKFNQTVPGLVGEGSSITAGTTRMYIWGDDQTGTCVAAMRSSNSTVTADTWVSFGLAEDEEIVSSDPIHRLFTFGNNSGYIQRSTEDITFDSNFGGNKSMLGVAFGLSNQPVLVSTANYAYVLSQSTNAGILQDSSASENQYTQLLDLQTIDLMAGTYDTATSANNTVFVLEPRRLGTFPFARIGKTNFPQWSSVPPNGDWMHLKNGVFLPWSGSVVP